MAALMPIDSSSLFRFRNRRDAEIALLEIVEDGGNSGEYRIEEAADGSCVIVVLETDSGPVVGAIGA